MRAHVRRRFGPVLMAMSLVALTFAGLAAAPAAEPAGASPAFTASGSILQVYTSGHTPGDSIDLQKAGTTIATGTADALGAFDFRNLVPGTDYTVVAGGASVGPLTVTAQDDNPPQSFYQGITLNEGYGYLPTRDGTKLAVNVTFPKGPNVKPGPWPVVVEYSGYDPAQPGPPPAESQIYPYFGYVVVAVNMRGTTCSGGAFWFFEEAQRTDGYDAIEAVANQPWSNGNVGMVGISYSGYSQLYVASTRPPHLQAITPLSPFSDGLGGILFPGGILNNGFALNWALDRQEAAKPAVDISGNVIGGHQWVKDRINGGDTTCRDNQVMRLQSQDLQAEIQRDRYNEPKYAFLDGRTFIPKINVPTYISSQWQDEQTGGYAAEVATMVAPNAYVRGEFTNGTHVDPLGPEDFLRVTEFVDLYVGKKVPLDESNAAYRTGILAGLKSIFGEDLVLPPNRFAHYTADQYTEAKAFYESEKPIRIRYENGGVPGKEGQPYATTAISYGAWPIPGTIAERWYMQPDLGLAKTPPTVADDQARGSTAYTYDPTVKRRTSFDGSTEAAWLSHPDIHWLPEKEGSSLSFETQPYTTKAAYAGNGSVDLWVRSSAADTEFEVTLTEVRPDGQEMAIQSGWMRARSRALDVASSTELRPRHTFTEADSAPMPPGQFVPVRIELFPFAHIMRPGSKLRVNIEAPGGNQPFWAFDALPGPATNEIAHSSGMPSSVVLPLLSDPNASFFSPATVPSCSVSGVTVQAQSLRNQPCRLYQPSRKPTAVTATPANGHIAVAWQAPATWPGAPALTGYRVQVAPTNDSVDVPAGTTSLDYANVGSGGTFTFRVSGLYSDVDAVSDASLPVSVGAPTPPQSANAVAGKLSATVSWAAPASDGGASVTGYTVTASPGGATCTWTTGPLACTVANLDAGTAYSFEVTATNALGTSLPASAGPVTPWSGSGFHPLTPFRVLDTRLPGAPFATLVAGQPKDLTVIGAGGGAIPATATAVVLNVTATGGSANSFLTVWPSGDAQPGVSNLNAGPGQTIANLVTVPVGANGKVSFANAAGATDVVADVVGFFDDGNGPGDRFTGIDPVRVLDSRGATGGWSGPLAAGGSRDLTVTGPGATGVIPATATAIVANVTVTQGTAGSYLRVWPSGAPEPNISNVNFAAGETIPNLVTVKIGANGKISLRNNAGATHVIVDVVGYFDPTTGSRYHPLGPVRFLDSRTNVGTAAGPWQGGETRLVPLGSVVPADATGIIANTTATQSSMNSFLRVFPAGGSAGITSNVNFGAGQTIPNLVMSKLGPGGMLGIFNQQGTVQVVADAQGYFSPS